MMNKLLTTHALHEDAFYAVFEPYRHPAASFDIWGGIGLETYGEDIETMMTVQTDFVWTIVEGEKNQWILPGIYRVNRICHLVTKRSHLFLPFGFKVSMTATLLTPLGLKRQVNRIKRILSSNVRVV